MNFTVSPTLENQLVLIRPLLSGDFDELYAVASDPVLWEHHPMSDAYNRNSFQQFFEEALQAGSELIIDQSENRVIGCTRFYNYDKEQSTVVIGHTFIARNYWGTGYNKSIKKLMLTYAFQFVDKVFFYVVIENIRSRRALEKIGAIPVQELIRYYKDKALKCLVYVIERAAFVQ